MPGTPCAKRLPFESEVALYTHGFHTLLQSSSTCVSTCLGLRVQVKGPEAQAAPNTPSSAFVSYLPSIFGQRPGALSFAFHPEGMSVTVCPQICLYPCLCPCCSGAWQGGEGHGGGEAHRGCRQQERPHQPDGSDYRLRRAVCRSCRAWMLKRSCTAPPPPPSPPWPPPIPNSVTL